MATECNCKPDERPVYDEAGNCKCVQYQPNPNRQGPQYRYSSVLNPTGTHPGDSGRGMESQEVYNARQGNKDENGNPQAPGTVTGGQLARQYDPSRNQSTDPSQVSIVGVNENSADVEVRDAARALMGVHSFSAYNPGIDPLSGQRISEDRQHQLAAMENQDALTGWLAAAVRGDGPSVAETQLKQGQEAARIAAASNAAGMRGVSPAVAARIQSQQQTVGMLGAGRDAAMLRAAEQQQYAQQLGGVLNQRRLADLQSQGLSQEQAQMILSAEMQEQGINAQIAEGIAARRQAGAGKVVEAVGTAIAGFSDIRAKEDIKKWDGGLEIGEEPEDYGSFWGRQPTGEPQGGYSREDHARAYAKNHPEGSGGTASDSGFGQKLRDALRAETADAQRAAIPDNVKTSEGPHQAPDAIDPEFRDVEFIPKSWGQDAASAAGEEEAGVSGGAGGFDWKSMMSMSDEHAKELVQENDQLRSALDRATGGGGAADPYTKKLEKLAQHSGYSAEDLSALRELKYTDKLEKLAGYSGYNPDDLKRLREMPEDPEIEQSKENLAPVESYTFRYKPEIAAATGDDTEPRRGVMAQDLLQSPAYRDSVVKGPGGLLALDPKRLLQANTAEVGGLDKRLKRIESALEGASAR